jgi:asparagine synthase (glutamine-hydrolysing)
MSVQFGTWNFKGAATDPEPIVKVRELLAPYGPDGVSEFSQPNITISHLAFHTTKKSRRERQPLALPSGAVLTWDGRLDNSVELIPELKGSLSPDSTDLAVVAAAYERWGLGSFARLVGDWALSIWDPNARSLVLAKDFVGVRHLFYSIDRARIVWSSVLDSFLLSERTFEINEEYIAGWLGAFPAADLTPYVGICSVPPASYVLVRDGHATVREHWTFSSSKTIHYRQDADYEEHFRTVFAEAVRRRLRSDTPVLAELSGGMDSSAIVCVADRLIADGSAEAPRLDTLSYYDDSEPNWNERPYFGKVEDQRGRRGCHVDASAQENLLPQYGEGRLASAPGAGLRSTELSAQIASCLVSGGHRVLLSGVGGDEVLGGVCTPLPELADLLATGLFFKLFRRMLAWSLAQRRPAFHPVRDVVRAFLPPEVSGEGNRSSMPWLHSRFEKRNRAALLGYPLRLTLFEQRPSFQMNLRALDGLRRQLGCAAAPSTPPFEKRYPYLDRDLLEFLYAIPREQIVRPGQRRSLMRRSLAGIIPEEILNRKRKAFAFRGPISALRSWTGTARAPDRLLTDSRGIIDQDLLRQALDRLFQGDQMPVVPMLRLIALEAWLRHASARSSFRPTKVNFQEQIRVAVTSTEGEVRPTDIHRP